MTKENLDKQSIKKYAENAYLNYSMYVILDRALPNVCLLYTSDAADE